MNDKELILVVDDEQHIRDLLEFNLDAAGYRVELAENGTDALEKARNTHPALILLDLMMPGMSGEEVCEKLKASLVTESIPIIVLSAKGDEVDRVLLLDRGADDYMVKPFSVRELIARVKALLRRSVVAESSREIIRAGALTVDSEKYEAAIDGKKIGLTLKEFELLKLLAQYENKVLTRDFLFDRIWGQDFSGETRTVDVHIRHLRQKLDKYADYIQTIRGVGYKLSVPQASR